jgi:hypothetical protein
MARAAAPLAGTMDDRTVSLSIVDGPSSLLTRPRGDALLW